MSVKFSGKQPFRKWWKNYGYVLESCAIVLLDMEFSSNILEMNLNVAPYIVVPWFHEVILLVTGQSDGKCLVISGGIFSLQSVLIMSVMCIISLKEVPMRLKDEIIEDCNASMYNLTISTDSNWL